MRQVLPAGPAPDGARTAGCGPRAVVRRLPGQLLCSRPGTFPPGRPGRGPQDAQLVTAGRAIHDSMQHIPNDVATTGLGLCASTGPFLTAGAPPCPARG
ncbi:ATP-dependent Clp protease proteolytic subunit [Streptomyces hirsutus]